MKDNEIMNNLTSFLTVFRNGRPPDELKTYFLSADLFALDMDGTYKPRPIAVGEMFYRLATSYTAHTLREPVSKVLFPIQLVGAEGGG